MPFHNPYHFVPVKPDARPGDHSVADFAAGNVGQVTHDRFVSLIGQGGQAEPVYSGRLLCRLTTEDPIVIGATREPLQDASHRVSPFRLDGKPAIPASTLRGLISSIAEAASNSALRVLENRSFSYRASLPGLSAIGMVVELAPENGTKELRLRPLALPTLQGPFGGAIPLERQYRKMFPKDRTPPLKVYVGDYHQIRAVSFVGDLPFRSFSRDDPQFCYARLHPRRWNDDHTLSPDSYQYRKPGRGGQAFLLTQRTTDELPPCVESGAPQSAQERQSYTRGILRILGVPGRDDIPHTKKHELFIPYPEDVEDTPTFPILKEALERFYTLADERTEARKEGPALPYEPRGTKRNDAPASSDDRRFRLKDGDLVYFCPNETGEAVAEIALSAVWRGWAWNSHDYFRRISPELLPFHRDRAHLTLAEQLFGFVEQRQRGQDSEIPAYALASRLRFSFGLQYPEQEAPVGDEVLLKVLDSPKPPSPALYFKRRNGQGTYISKSELNPASHVPQGRKFYLHRRGNTGEPWKTSPEAADDNLTQKSRVQPLKAGLTFYFHIDFDNLSRVELGLLCYAVRPTEPFRHKLGMGKPLGLGKVRIDPVGLFYVDRLARYRDTSLFDARRYHGRWIPATENVQDWPATYAREQEAIALGHGSFPAFETLRQDFSDNDNMDADIRQALELLGDPSKVHHPVHTPQVAGVSGHEMENETYRWFVANDIGSGRGSDRIQPGREFLKPLNTSSTDLPTLPEHPWNA